MSPVFYCNSPCISLLRVSDRVLRLQHEPRPLPGSSCHHGQLEGPLGKIHNHGVGCLGRLAIMLSVFAYVMVVLGFREETPVFYDINPPPHFLPGSNRWLECGLYEITKPIIVGLSNLYLHGSRVRTKT